MRGRKKAIWVVAISAALITAGLIISCGDDEDAATRKCKRACEVFNECEWIYPGSDLGESMEDCVEGCKEGTADLTPEELEALVECIENTDCDFIEVECLGGEE